MISTGYVFVWGLAPIPEQVKEILKTFVDEGYKVKIRRRNVAVMKIFASKWGNTVMYVPVAETREGPWKLLKQGENMRVEK